MTVREVVARFLRRIEGATSHRRLWTDGWRLFSYGRLIVWWANLERTRLRMSLCRLEPAATERHRALLLAMNMGESDVEVVEMDY